MRHFAIRTVKDGMVKINGKYYRPSPMHGSGFNGLEYDGRWEGKRLAFGLYYPGFKSVSLWGTEAMYRKCRYRHSKSLTIERDGHVYLAWEWWNES